MINFGSGARQRATMIPAYDAPPSHQRSAPLAPPPSFVPEAYVSEADRAIRLLLSETRMDLIPLVRSFMKVTMCV
jgi:hypothetical protein